MPKRNRTLPFVQADGSIKPAIAQGHPWIYRDAITRAPNNLESGTWVHVQCGNLQQYGLWDAEGAIAVRLFGANSPPNRAWVYAAVERAWQLRRPLRTAQDAAGQPQTTAYRLLYGESDGLPGIVVDLYGLAPDTSAYPKTHEQAQEQEKPPAWGVVRSYSPGVASLLDWVVDAVWEIAGPAGVVYRGEEGPRLVRGEWPPNPLIMAENGLRFEVDLLQGQKTGFFLDQRENRQTIARWSAEWQPRRVLNLFSYTGGFSVCAALGATNGPPPVQVVSVDSAEPALEAARRNFLLNGLDPEAHEFVLADCFDLLAKYHGEGRRFDLIIVDPPSFARSRAQHDRALHAYRRLNSSALKCLEPGGLLASSSCTSQVSPDAFRTMLAEAAADAKRRVLLLHDAGHPIDHPVPAHFSEARYLKFIIGKVYSLT